MSFRTLSRELCLDLCSVSVRLLGSAGQKGDSLMLKVDAAGVQEARWSARLETSALSECTSVEDLETAATVGIATSTILSAMSSSLESSVASSAKVRTMRTFDGRRWRKSSFRKALLSCIAQR